MLRASGWACSASGGVEADANADLACGKELASVYPDDSRVNVFFGQAGELRAVDAAHGHADSVAHANICTGGHVHEHPASGDIGTSPRYVSTGGAMEELKVRRQRVALMLPPVI